MSFESDPLIRQGHTDFFLASRRRAAIRDRTHYAVDVYERTRVVKALTAPLWEAYFSGELTVEELLHLQDEMLEATFTGDEGES